MFQVESEGMRRVLRDMKPNKFEHIVAAISLYRPGPMEYIPRYVNRMHGKEPVTYRHELLTPILSETYGIIVYQEQIIQIASELAGYTPGDADLMRRAVAKKKEKDLIKHKAKFIEGAAKRNIAEEVAISIFDEIEFFANYGFNKSHAADYAVITAQTAFLKVHYPVEYMTALLTVELDDLDKVTSYITECRKMGIAVLPPHINHSDLQFTIHDGAAEVAGRSHGQPAFDFQTPKGAAIRFGLAAVKNVGHGPVEEILRARSEGLFTSLEDFCERVDLRLVNKRALECLIKVGAFDAFASRSKILAVLDRMMMLSAKTWEARDVGQIGLFDAFDLPDLKTSAQALFDPAPTYQEAPAREWLGWEKELLGVYVSEHPLQRVTANLHSVITCTCNDITPEKAGKGVMVAGMVASVRVILTRKGDRMAFVRLEDLHGSCEVTVFPKILEAAKALLEEGNVVLTRGKVEVRNDRASIVADEISASFSYAQAESARLPTFASPAPSWGEEEAVDAIASGAGDEGDEPPLVFPAGAMPAPDHSALTPMLTPPLVLAPVATNGGNGAVAATPGPRLLRILFPRTGSLEEDRHRLTQAVSLCRRYNGQDRFVVRVQTHNELIDLDFPNTTTHYCSELEERLYALLGEGCIEIDR